MHRYDVVVIGAGLAGLACAKNLLARSMSLKVIVLEARDRVGGRLLWEQNADIGGGWVGPTQDLLLAEIESQKLVTDVQTWSKDIAEKDMCESCGYPEPTLPAEAKVELDAFIAKLDELAKTLITKYGSEPWKCVEDPNADIAQADKLTVEMVMNKNLKHEESKHAMSMICKTILATPPSEVGFLCLLWFVARVGGVAAVGDGPGAAQHLKIRGGTQQVCSGMARGLHVQLGRLVSLVELPPGQPARVHAGGQVYSGERVVVAMAPPLVTQIRFDPPLPEDRQRLQDGMVSGRAIKTFAVYDTPFWLDGPSGPSESRPSFTSLGPVANVFLSEVDGRPSLTGLVVADQADTWTKRTPQELRAAVLAQYHQMYRDPRALTPRLFLSKDWVQEQYSGGCYSALFPPNLLTAAGPALRRPVGRVHWACSEDADRWAGYMEGAMVSGQRCAAEVFQALRPARL
mmetsp:Transcript_58878/g.155862  ORF Transcript_58878/g.155862 Transcript_58878/m.155862 type:complete len:459 (+) Transcript_58878:93-1469(+)|eukprot:CAMPEP_0113705180 /NCGR_PEP_ID=MMETSP0038_2-20120614/26984_1 /TAXON_ID=2898 /ORGANISM="Cryptomonas paramecium" /LENGTH=458 /DNA_ID=CAMNT_0000630149 /DNA_START=32 /DNA_END=1408 /DNA_ORIENTATION=- /assembly_acc=CAM_ASM_000170